MRQSFKSHVRYDDYKRANNLQEVFDAGGLPDDFHHDSTSGPPLHCGRALGPSRRRYSVTASRSPTRYHDIYGAVATRAGSLCSSPLGGGRTLRTRAPQRASSLTRAPQHALLSPAH
jgi:hypothetical protein